VNQRNYSYAKNMQAKEMKPAIRAATISGVAITLFSFGFICTACSDKGSGKDVFCHYCHGK
jgi:hypothetical protein